MSVKRNTIRYGAAAAALALVIIAGSSFLAGSSYLPWSHNSYQGPKSLLVIQLTDPPHVPVGTTSLNLTYSSLNLLVGEPTGVDHQMNTNAVPVTPSGGSATLDLLKLQNISQTIGSVSLPDGSVIYSVTFAVSGISIDVNGTVSPVSLASGGNSFTVTIAGEHELHGTNKALLELNPVVIDTPSGFKLIPSSVGVIRQSEGEGEYQFGSQHQLTGDDEHDLENALGSVSANLLALSVSGITSTITVQVNNTGSESVQLNAIGIHGNFTAQGNQCLNGESTSTTTTTSTETQTSTNNHEELGQGPECEMNDHSDEVVFVPVIPASSTTTTTTTSSATSSTLKSCTADQLTLVNGDSADDHGDRGLVLSPGECINLTFSGIIMFGESPLVLIPSTSSGQTYEVHIIASNGANLQLDCVLPLGANSCKVDQHSEQD